MTLGDLKRGERARICSLNAGAELRRRLQDMGFTEGARTECVLISPLGDPAAYRICGAVIALRRCDAACIRISREKSGKAV